MLAYIDGALCSRYISAAAALVRAYVDMTSEIASHTRIDLCDTYSISSLVTSMLRLLVFNHIIIFSF